MKRLLLVIGVVGASLLLTTQGGAVTTISFPLSTFIDVAPGPGYPMGSVDVPANVQGLVCNVDTVNNESVHSGSAVTFTSGDQSVTLEDIEGASGKVTSGTLLLAGATITATATVGPDGIFSGGADATFNCPEPPTTTVPPVTTTLAPTTTTLQPGAGSTVSPAEASDVVVVQPAFTG